jgi:hypothetical protein
VEPNCNIYNRKCHIEIPNGYEICFQCKGLGCFITAVHYKERFVEVIECSQCNGKGYIDWIKYIKKVQKHVNFLKEQRYINFKCIVYKCKKVKRWARNFTRQYQS